MDISNILSALSDNNSVNEISKKFNLRPNQVSSVIGNALPLLLQGMQKNVATENGAASLNDALSHHAGNVDNVATMLKSADLTDGSNIVSHLLGGNRSSILSNPAQKSDFSNLQVGNILASIAPSLMALLGHAKQTTNTGASGMGSLLGTLLGGNSGGLPGSVLSDKDGDSAPDILGGLGKIFRK